jgi:hypothetical protein
LKEDHVFPGGETLCDGEGSMRGWVFKQILERLARGDKIMLKYVNVFWLKCVNVFWLKCVNVFWLKCVNVF